MRPSARPRREPLGPQVASEPHAPWPSDRPGGSVLRIEHTLSTLTIFNRWSSILTSINGLVRACVLDRHRAYDHPGDSSCKREVGGSSPPAGSGRSCMGSLLAVRPCRLALGFRARRRAWATVAGENPWSGGTHRSSSIRHIAPVPRRRGMGAGGGGPACHRLAVGESPRRPAVGRGCTHDAHTRFSYSGFVVSVQPSLAEGTRDERSAG